MHSASFKCARTCAMFQECKFGALFFALGNAWRVLSHVTKVDVVIKDLDALKAAVARLKLEFREGQREYRWWGHSVGDYPIPAGMTEKDLGKCDHAIRVDSRAYEVGVIQQKDGTYSLVWDFYAGGYGLEKAVGKDCKTLLGAYTLECARNAAVAQNWMHEETLEGTLRIYHPSGGVIDVSPNGTVDASGFTGSACNVAAIIENALGNETERTNKESYYVESNVIRETE